MEGFDRLLGKRDVLLLLQQMIVRENHEKVRMFTAETASRCLHKGSSSSCNLSFHKALVSKNIPA
jgi:hypothetical protein